ncbi:hypothetical protein BGZ49_003476 [Haplosporangium sp. Z 27]|nr:hypothetical protein BGZ49_003476 [Haplosporangium sp. Z 27]
MFITVQGHKDDRDMNVVDLYGILDYTYFLKAQWVAPLGSIALIFNFIFAKILVGTRITRMDVFGTIVVMISVVWIVIFGGMNSGEDIEESLNLSQLKALFSRVAFTIYFSVLNMVILALLSIGLYAYWAISLDDNSGQLRKKMKAKLTKMLETSRFAKIFGLSFAENEGLEAEAKDLKLRKLVAMIMATSGGLIASQTLLLAKSGIKLITSTLAGDNQFKDMLSFFILFVLVFTAILQVYCMNTALKLYDSVMVVPMFYGYYTAFGLINSTVYLNQLQRYPPWALFLILVGIGTLIYGVQMLSAPKPEHNTHYHTSADAEYNDDDGEDGESGRGFSKQSKFRLNESGSSEKLPGGLYGGEISAGGGAGGDVKIKKTSLKEKEEMKEAGESKSVGTNLILQGTDATYEDVDLGTTEPVIYENMANVPESELSLDQQKLLRRSSLPHNFLKAFGLDGRKSSVDRGRRSAGGTTGAERKRGSLPKIDTSFVTRGRSETRREIVEPRPMSPSEFRAQYTNSPLPLKPKHLQNGIPGLGSRSASPIPIPENDNGRRGRSPRWKTENEKTDHVLEDLNLFKVMRRNSTDVTSTSGLPLSPSQAYQGPYTRRDSLTGLPSAWNEPNRRANHSMLFGENEGSRGSSRSLSPTRSRRQSVQDGIWATTNLNRNTHENGEHGPREPQSYQNHFFTGTPPPTSAITGVGNTSASSMNIPTSPQRTLAYHSSVSQGHGRQLSFTTKNDIGNSTLSVNNTSSSLLASGPGSANLLVTSTGTFGSFSPSTPSPASASGPITLPLSVQHQLQQLQQHQHHPTSQLQHSITTSSISTIGSYLQSMSSSSLAQMAMDVGQENLGNVDKEKEAGQRDSSKCGPYPELAESADLWMNRTPTQTLGAIELDLEKLDRQVREKKSSEMQQCV